MSTERVIITYRRQAERLRAIRDGDPRNGGISEYINGQVADALDAYSDALEEDLRQEARVHQDRT